MSGIHCPCHLSSKGTSMRTQILIAAALAATSALPATAALALPASTVQAASATVTAPSVSAIEKVPNRKTIPTPASFRRNGITAHRGFSGGHPENTLESLQAGIDLGADWIETDVHTTKDGIQVVLHDTTTGRTAGIDRIVRESTWDELKNLDVNSEYRDMFGLPVEQVPAQRMPLLSEVLDLIAKQNRTRLQLQPKDAESTAAAVAMVQKRGLQAHVGFNDGDLAKLSLVKKLDPSLYVFWDLPAKGDLAQEIETARTWGFDALVLNQARVTPQTIQQIQNAGFEAGAWTVNDTETMRTFLGWGLDRLYTDHADRALLIAGRDARKGFAHQLLSYWSMDPTNGFRQVEDLGSPNPMRAARLVGDARLVRGKAGKAVRLDGAGDRLDVPVQVLPDKAPEFAVSAWFRSTSDRPQTLITTTGSSVAALQVKTVGDDVTLSATTAASGREALTAPGAVASGKWQHVAVVVREQSVRIVDGKTLATSDKFVIDGTRGLRIGANASGSGEFFTGDIDEVAVWNRALSPKEINQLAAGKRILKH